jgi:hypothetical protein
MMLIEQAGDFLNLVLVPIDEKRHMLNGFKGKVGHWSAPGTCGQDNTAILALVRVDRKKGSRMVLY